MPIIGTPQRLGQRLAGGEADAHAGEQPRPDVDGDQADLVELDVGLGADELDRRRERLGVAPAAATSNSAMHALVAADRDADLLGRRLDAQDQHGPLRIDRLSVRPVGSSRRTASAPRAAAHVRPTCRPIVTTRASSSSPGRARGARARWSPNDDSATSPHSTSTMPSVLGQLGQRQVGDLGCVVEPVEVGVVQRQAAPCRSCARA